MPIEITVPGSKSIANRVLALAFLCGKKIDIKNIPDCDDVKYIIKGLKKLKEKKSGKIKIFTGNSGTATRFLTAIAAVKGIKVEITGDKIMSKRPIEPLVKALSKLGGKISIPGNVSSQFITALLLVAPFAKTTTIINIEQKLYSKPYVSLSLKLMKQFGIKVMNKNFRQFIVKPNQKPTPPKTFTIEGDATSASYIGAYALLHPEKNIVIKNISKKSLQGDIKFLDYIEKIKTKGSLGTIDMNETPDLVMTFAVLAIFTKGKTKITNIANLRIKESDRIEALKNEIKKFGIKVKTGKDFIEITGNPKLLTNPPSKKILIETYNDHRIAMAFGVLEDLFPNLLIKNKNCVSKSYTTYWKDMEKMRGNTNIVLTGLRGSGKSTMGKLIAKNLKMNFVDIDTEIEKEEGRKITDIVEQKGWKYFRTLEKKVTKRTAKLKKTVIATGGGTILDKDNLKALKQNGKIIYLFVTPETSIKRIENKTNRPRLTDEKTIKEEIKKLFHQRDPIYRATACLTFHKSKNLKKDTEKILKAMNYNP